MPAAADAPARAGLRWLATRRVTLGAVSLLFAVFAVQRIVLWEFGAASWEFLFLAHTDPTPGWLIAPFAHRSFQHLVTTATVVLVYGALVERAVGPATYAWFYLTAAYTSTAAQVGAYASGTPGLGTLGASGAALGLVALFVLTTVGRYLGDGSDPHDVELLFAATGTGIVCLLVANDFLPALTLAGGTARFGHLGGIFAGVSYGLFRLGAEKRSVPGT